MTKQSTPHTQTQQNTQPEETDSEPNAEQQGISATDADLYSRMEGADHVAGFVSDGGSGRGETIEGAHTVNHG